MLKEQKKKNQNPNWCHFTFNLFFFQGPMSPESPELVVGKWNMMRIVLLVSVSLHIILFDSNSLGLSKFLSDFLASLINNSCTVVCINLSTPVGDQDRICPFYIILYNIMQTSDENKEKYQLWVIWQTERRITNEILRFLGVEHGAVRGGKW